MARLVQFLLQNMHRGIHYVLVFLGCIIGTTMVIFHFVEGLAWVDAFYFTITTLTTVGYGDHNLSNAHSWLKLYGTFIMIAGPMSIAVLFTFISGNVIKVQLKHLLEKRGANLKNHVIVCGEGGLGLRIVKILREYDVQVIYVIQDDGDLFLDQVRATGTDVIIGDPAVTETLKSVNMSDARSIVVATHDDLKNLGIAVNARSIKTDCQVVLQMHDEALVDKMEPAFQIRTAFSSTAIAAPAFALAALDPQKSIVNSFQVHGEEFVTIHITPKEGSALDKKPLKELLFELRITIVLAKHDDPLEETLKPDEEYVLIVPFANLQELQGMNV
jgi:Trk K+ transport system NAD-binding subunit